MAIFPDLNITSDNFVPEIVADVAANAANSDGSVVGVGILILIYTVSYLSVKKLSFKNAFLFSSIFTLVVSFLLGKLDLITDEIQFICFGIMIVAIIMFTRKEIGFEA